jgi:GNAT superfamily N-acetyltransferase
MADPSTFTIRPAVAGDEALLAAFIRDLAVYEKLEHEMVATEDQLREHLFGDRPAAEAVFLESDGIPAGFALYFINFSTFLGKPGIYLEDLFVKPEFRGRGFGKALLAHLAKQCAERGYGRLEWSVLDWNEPSIRFYKSLGAAAMDEWTTYRLTGKALSDLADHS